jgi:Domain of unknown function (DUF1707)
MTTPIDPSAPSVAPETAGTGMRVSDADRAVVADRLARHFGDGRLDKAEFDHRLDRALRAKTRADLIALLSDLPEGLGPIGDEPGKSRSQRRRERELLRIQLERERLLLKHERREHRRQERELRWQSVSQVPAIIGIVVIVLVLAAVLRHLYSIWLVLAVLVFLWLRYRHHGGNSGGNGSNGGGNGSISGGNGSNGGGWSQAN